MIKKLDIYRYFKISHLTVVFYQNAPIRNFLKDVPYDYSCPSTKDTLTDRVYMYCDLHIGSIKLKQNHSSYCRTKESRAVGDEQYGGTRKVRPQRVAARCQKELLCAMAFQELQQHAVKDFDFDDAEADIIEIVHEIGTPVLDGIESVSTSD